MEGIEESKDFEIKKLEDAYGVNFEKISEEEAENAIFIPFEQLKAMIEDSSGSLSRSGWGGSYNGWLTYNNNKVIIKVKDVQLKFDVPFKVTFQFEMEKSGILIMSQLNFKDAFVDYGKRLYKSVILSQRSLYGGIDWHRVYGHFSIQFTTMVGGSQFRVIGEYIFDSGIDLGRYSSGNIGHLLQVRLRLSF